MTEASPKVEAIIGAAAIWPLKRRLKGREQFGALILTRTHNFAVRTRLSALYLIMLMLDV